MPNQRFSLRPMRRVPSSRLFQPLGQLERLFEQEAAGLGQLQAPPDAIEQRHAHFLLELADLARQRRLGHVQQGCRPRHIEFLGTVLAIRRCRSSMAPPCSGRCTPHRVSIETSSVLDAA